MSAPSEHARALPGHYQQGPIDTVWRSRLDDVKPHPERPRCICGSLQLGFRLVFGHTLWVPEDRDSTDPWNGLLQQLHILLDNERRHVDLAASRLRLDLGMTKNGDGRVVSLTPEVHALLAEQLRRVVR